MLGVGTVIPGGDQLTYEFVAIGEGPDTPCHEESKCPGWTVDG
jgi:hypothetical protein